MVWIDKSGNVFHARPQIIAQHTNEVTFWITVYENEPHVAFIETVRGGCRIPLFQLQNLIIKAKGEL